MAETKLGDTHKNARGRGEAAGLGFVAPHEGRGLVDVTPRSDLHIEPHLNAQGNIRCGPSFLFVKNALLAYFVFYARHC